MVNEIKGKTRGIMDIHGHAGIKSFYNETTDGRNRLYFDVSWGINDIASHRFNTWEHCIAYDRFAEYLKNIKPGDYLHIIGYVVTNPVYSGGKIVYNKEKPVTKRFTIVTFAEILKDDKKPAEKQLSLVEAG
jgi:hypothetical protein